MTWLRRRFPVRDSRWRMCWPLEASMGAVPVQDAKWLRSGNRAISPASARIRAALTGPMPQIELQPSGFVRRVAGHRLDPGDPGHHQGKMTTFPQI